MEKSKLVSLIKRVITSLFLIPLVVGSVLGGYPWIIFLAWTAAALLSWEWAEMVPNKKAAVFSMIYFSITTLVMLLDSLFLGLALILVGLVLVFVKSKQEEYRKLLLLGVPYISIGIGSVLALYAMFGPQMVLWFMFVIWSVDIGGYVFGCTIKGPKLAPKISPNKTWAGFLGGMFLAVVVSSLYFHFFGADEIILKYAAISAVLAVISQIGDLIESAIKRYLGIKDSSNLIPGHGGIFDRIDGLVFAAPFAYLILRNFIIFID